MKFTKLLLAFLLILAPSIAGAQVINGFGGFRFGTDQKEILATINDSAIVKQKGDVDDLDVFVENLKLQGEVYDMCMLSFYEGKLMGGTLAQLFHTQDTLLNKLEYVKNAVAVQPEDYVTDDPTILRQYFFRDVDDNQLLAQALHISGKYVLRLRYFFAELYAKQKKAYDARRPAVVGGVEADVEPRGKDE